VAAGGFKEFVAGETLDQDEINNFLMQGMLVFAGTAARGSAITAPVEGQFTYLADSDKVEFYDSTQWVELSTTPGAAVVSGTTGSPTLGTVSSGGTTYNVYSFTGSGSITFSEAGFAELLVLGGGGSGGVSRGGGGAGGGMLSVAQAYLSAGTATVVVGAGGASQASAGDNYGLTGVSGNTSRIGDFFSPGGGGGGMASYDFPDIGTRSNAGQNGGSGGGAGGFNTGVTRTAGNGISPIGNNGGNAAGEAGGGGGGAGASGANATSNNGGNGGNGAASSITGSSVTYAGGGGAGGSSTNGSGGTGGGGAGGNLTATNGGTNLGGGGGGVFQANTTGASGGSGIVIVRVAV